MHLSTDDVRISAIKALTPPQRLMAEYPCDDTAAETVFMARSTIRDILHGRNERLLVVVGPCSIHDTEAALDYAERLNQVRKKLRNSLEIDMRVYFEKPR